MENIYIALVILGGCGFVFGVLGGIAEKIVDRIIERRLADYED